MTQGCIATARREANSCSSFIYNLVRSRAPTNTFLSSFHRKAGMGIPITQPPFIANTTISSHSQLGRFRFRRMVAYYYRSEYADAPSGSLHLEGSLWLLFVRCSVSKQERSFVLKVMTANWLFFLRSSRKQTVLSYYSPGLEQHTRLGCGKRNLILGIALCLLG